MFSIIGSVIFENPFLDLEGPPGIPGICVEKGRMSSKEFDCVVVGNEPGGLWLLEALADFPGQPFKVAWIRDENRPSPVALPEAMANQFAVPLSSTWSPELVLPGRVFEWSRESIETHFPELNLAQVEQIAVKSPYRATQIIRRALRLRPELLSMAEAIWKWGGRSPGTSVEMRVLGALQFLKTGWWDPLCQIPEEISVWQTSAATNPIEEIKGARRGTTLLRFRGLEPIASRCIVLNLPGGRLARYLRLLSEDRWPIDPESTQIKTRLYRLALTLDPGAFSPSIAPLCVFVDSDEIPDPENEMWPVIFSSGAEVAEITAWATAPKDFVLEDIAGRLRGAMQRLNRLFPLLSSVVRQVDGPLDMDSCHDEQLRERAIRELEESAIETYQSTLLNTATRWKKVFYLGPNVNSHFPYPAGPLIGAQKVLDDLMAKRKRGVVRKASDPLPAPTSNA